MVTACRMTPLNRVARRECTVDEDGDAIEAVVEEDDAEEPMLSKPSRTRRHNGFARPKDESGRSAQRCCQYRTGKGGTTMNHAPLSEETSREGLQDGRGARTA